MEKSTMKSRLVPLARKKAYRSNLARTVGALALSTAIAGVEPAFAQDGGESEKAEEPIDVMIVTGSNIRSRSRDFETPSPIQTVGEKQIADAGAIQVQDIFKGLTANSGSQLSNRQNALQGLSQFSLRGLGIGSTLTLINGRRAGLAPITDSSGQLFTDSNQYPINMIERVEVLTDGASSTYGSEAVAGVVNIFTRDSFEGLEFTSELRAGRPDSLQAGIAFGTSFDRGHFTIFGNYRNSGSAVRSDFDVILEGNTFEDGISGAFDSATGSPGRFNLASPNPNFGADPSTLPSGTDVTSQFLQAGNTVADPDCLAAGGLPDPAANNCRYYFIDQVRIIPEEDRIQLFSKLDYDITDRIHFFAEASFSRNEIRDGAGGNLTRVTTNDGGFLVPGDHPFNFFVSDGAGGITYAGPEAFAADPSLEAVDLIYRGRIIGRDGDGNDNFEDISTIFTNTRLVGGFDYDIGDNWVLNASYMWSLSDFSRRMPRDWNIPAFQDQILLGVWNPFGTRLATPDLISPKDGVSDAANSQADLDAVGLVRSDTGEVIQEVAEMIFSGDTGIELPGGTIALAVGGQYRAIQLEDIPDGRYQSGQNRLNETIPAVFGKQTAYALFGEVVLPVFDRLELQAALRYEDYGNDGGDTFDPKFSAKFDVTDSLALRASYGTSFQAPSIRQISGVISNAAIVDPADPAAGNFNITVITVGSDTLTPQSAENINVGMIYRSEFGLDMSVDFFHYDYSGLILPGADPQFIFDQVFLGNLPADLATREATGQPATVIASFENRGDAQVSGLDIVGRYSADIGDATLSFDASGTIILEYQSSEFGDIKGNRNFTNGFGSTPDVKLNGGLTLDIGNHTGNATVRYINSYLDDQSNTSIDSQTTLDLRYAYYFDTLLGGNGSTLGIGVTNVFDTDPPRLAQRPFFDNEVHDIRGRAVFLSIKHQF